MADRLAPAVPVILACLDFGDPLKVESIAEARELVTSAGGTVVTVIEGKRDRPDAATFAGSGKVEELKQAVIQAQSKMVVFNHQLSAAQIRNLEKALATPDLTVRVLDRTDLILEIFALRARSHEGKLQVELAKLQHLSTRLVRGWTHLERQQGGQGLRGGPGEKQIELDRRMIADRVKLLKDRLKKVGKQRDTQRSSRSRSGVFRVAIVGYTNAGKSTLFNRMARATTLVADKLFATLDTTTRKAWMQDAAGGIEITLSDTVGFIRDLPHGLVAAFRATLDEATDADLLLHVVDAANAMRERQVEDVGAVLAEIGADRVPQVLVMNKIDLTADAEARVERDEYGKISSIRLSAVSGAGIAQLREGLAEIARAAKARNATDLAAPAALAAN
jgi:GTP-binding protein HflX